MAAGTFDFPCEHCGRDLRTTADAIGRMVTCPGCRRKTRADLPDEPPPPPRSRLKKAGPAVPWMWIAGAGAVVLLVAGIGVAFAAVMLSTSRRDKPTTTTVASTTTAKHQETVPATPPGPPPDATAAAGTTGPGTPPPPPAPKAAEWKLSGPTVRTGTRVRGDFNHVLTAEAGYDMVEVFVDVDCPGPARSEGFDCFAVSLTVRGTTPGAEPVRRAALGCAIKDDGPDKTAYFLPGNLTMGKAGDSIELSQGKGTAVTIFPRVTGEKTGPCRIAPKQNPTRLGFAFSAPKGSVPVELRVGDGTLALTGTGQQTADAGKTAKLDLPGAKGKQFDKTGSLPAGVELAQVYMTDKPFTPPTNPLPQTFASGTKTLDVVISFKRRPPGGTSVWREVVGKDGVVKLKGTIMMTSENNATGLFEIPLECAPVSGSYPDGDYQTRILVNDKVIGLLNWTIGGTGNPGGPVGAAAPAGAWKPVEVCRLNTEALDAAFRPGGILAVVSGKLGLSEWDATTGLPLRTVTTASGHELVGASPDLRFGLSVRRPEENRLGELHLWDLTKGESIRSWPEPDGTWDKYGLHGAVSADGKLAAASYHEAGVQKTADGGIRIIGNTKKDAYLWDGTTGKTVHKPLPTDFAVAVSADGQWLLTSDKAKHVVITDTRTGSTVRTLEGATSTAICLFVSADKKFAAASCGTDKPTVLVWDATTGKLLHQWEGLKSFVRGVAFSPDGRAVVAAERGEDSKGIPPVLHRWEIATGKELGSLTVNQMTDIYSIALSPDGETVAGLGYAGKQPVVQVWKAGK